MHNFSIFLRFFSLFIIKYMYYLGNFVLDNEENNNVDSDASNDEALSESSSSQSDDFYDTCSEEEDDPELIGLLNAYTIKFYIKFNV